MTRDQSTWNTRVQAKRKARQDRRRERQGAFGNAKMKIPKEGSRRPFHRMKLLIAKVNETYSALQAVGGPVVALNTPEHDAYMAARTALMGYESRGHGGRHRTRNRCIGGVWSQDRSKYPAHQGASECGRRVFRSMSGTDQAFIRSIEQEVTE